jgi:hypothetical protein
MDVQFETKRVMGCSSVACGNKYPITHHGKHVFCVKFAQMEMEGIKNPHVLIFGKHDYIVQNVAALLHKEGFTTVAFLDVHEILEHLKVHLLDVILVSGAVNPHHCLDIRKALASSASPNAKIIEHNGGPATIIREVRQALSL